MADAAPQQRQQLLAQHGAGLTEPTHRRAHAGCAAEAKQGREDGDDAFDEGLDALETGKYAKARGRRPVAVIQRILAAAVALLLLRAAFWHQVTPRQLRPGQLPRRRCEYLEEAEAAVRTSTLPHAPRVAIVTMLTGMEPEVVELSMRNKRQYASLHGYALVQADDMLDRSRQPQWSKLKALLALLPEYDFLMWVDADALFANFTVRVEDIVDGTHDLFYARDELDINSGVLIVRNSEWSRWYLQEAWDQEWLVTPYNFRSTHEQRAIHYLHGSPDIAAEVKALGRRPHPREAEVREHTQIVPHCALNSNVCEEFWLGLLLWRRTPWPGVFCDNVYANGDFVIHLAGKSPGSYKQDLLEQFSRKIDIDNAAALGLAQSQGGGGA